MGVVVQDIEIGGLRHELSRVTVAPEVWLDGYYATARGCPDHRASRIFEKVYRKRTDRRAAWFVHVLVRVACSEEIATDYLRYHCREARTGSAKTRVEVVVDELGSFCVSPAVAMPRSTTFRSFVGVQSGVLGVSFYGSNYDGPESAKQIAIDNLTSRLRKVNEKTQSKIPSEP